VFGWQRYLVASPSTDCQSSADADLWVGGVLA
jgi:hypothetical protein